MNKLTGLLLCMLLWAGTAQGLGFENGGKYDAARHSLFMLGTFPDEPVLNDAFFLAQYADQLRGIGWQTSHPIKKVALVTPQHFLTATHFKTIETAWEQGIGSITFLDASGNTQTFTISNITSIYKDISIGTLDTPIPDELGIRPFPVASIEGDGPKGREVFYVGNAPSGNLRTIAIGRTGFHKTIDHPASDGLAALRSDEVSSEYSQDRVYGVTGDSGSPSFFLENGELILLGHHYFPRLDPILSLQAEAVNNHISNTGYSLNIRNEPPSGCGSGAMQGAFMTLAIVCWRRNHRENA